MKLIIGMIYYLLILLLILLIAALMAPRSKTVVREKHMDVPAKSLFPYISQFEHWKQWDPWYPLDPDQNRIMHGEIGDADYGYDWTSDHRKLGSGSVRMNSFEPHRSVDLTILLGSGRRQMELMSRIELEEEHGSTTVRWSITAHQAFPFRIMNYFLERWVAADQEAGLAKLKEVAERQAEEGVDPVTLLSIHGVSYAAVDGKVKFKDINAFSAENYPKIYAFIRTNDMEDRSAPRAMYHTWDTENKETEMTVAVAVSDPMDRDADSVELSIGMAQRYSNRITYEMKGGYAQAKAVHDALEAWIRDEGKTVDPPPMEEYIKGPYDQVDSSEYITRITYFFE